MKHLKQQTMKDMDFLRKIMNLTKITEAQCDQLEVICKGLDIEFTRLAACDSAWREAAMRAYNELTRQAAEKENSKKLYILRGNVNVSWKDIQVNNATLTDEKAVELLAEGFPGKFFIKINGQMVEPEPVRPVSFWLED